MKGIIVYASTYGCTREYAEQIESATGWKAVEAGSVEDEELKAAETVIIGSPVIKSSPVLAPWIHKNWNLLKSRNVVLFTTSGSNPMDSRLHEGVKRNLSPAISEYISYIPLGGRMVFTLLSTRHKLLLRIGKLLETDPIVKKKMLRDVDNTDTQQIMRVIDAAAKEAQKRDCSANSYVDEGGRQ